MSNDASAVGVGSAVERVQSVSCTIHSRVVESGGGSRSREKTRRCYALADGRYREERRSSTSVFDGTALWVIPSDGGVVTRSERPLPPLDRMLDPRWLLEEHDVTATGPVEHDGRPAVNLEAGPKQAAGIEAEHSGGVSYSLIVDAAYGTLLFMRDEASGVEVELTDVRFNQALDDALFEYAPEAGRRVQSAGAGPVQGAQLLGALGAAAKKWMQGGR